MASRSARLEPLFVLRLMTGPVFVLEGIQKFLLPSELGVGQFVKIGIPWPHVIGPFVGAAEIVGGLMLVFGLWTACAALALLINISVAIVSTKIPILLGHPFGPFSLPKLSRYGFWAFAHQARTDWCMFLATLAITLNSLRRR